MCELMVADLLQGVVVFTLLYSVVKTGKPVLSCAELCYPMGVVYKGYSVSRVWWFLCWCTKDVVAHMLVYQGCCDSYVCWCTKGVVVYNIVGVSRV